jgi:hypothetical protein
MLRGKQVAALIKNNNKIDSLISYSFKKENMISNSFIKISLEQIRFSRCLMRHI